MIARQNILELIGKYTNRYSSCIITSFSFDFTFFEERVMSVLRSANIKNINVFVDGNYLEHSLEKSTGKEFSIHKTYSLIPIYETGVFHPKMMLLSGPKHGLLIIGSGNLTSSGLSTNDEIWGAFHLDSLESMNVPIFAHAWQYLQLYLSQAKGFNIQKIKWISNRTPWLNDLQKLLPNSFISIDKEQEVRFIANTPGRSTFKELKQWLPATKIKRLNIISPFYNENGSLLEQFTNQYEIKEFNCITELEFGILPTKLNFELESKIKFYDWKKVVKDFKENLNRLHAKLFHFVYEDGWEYLYIGSANATLAAFGSDTTEPKNAEAGLLLRRKIINGYLKDLGININESSIISVTDKSNKSGNRGDVLPKLKFENRIIYSELNGSRLTFVLKDQNNQQLEFETLNDDLEVLETFNIEPNKSEYKIDLNLPEKAKYICLFQDKERVSNYAIIHNVAIQSKCNPDPNQEKLNGIIENISIDPESDHYIELLSYADYNWIDDDIQNESSVRKGGAKKENTEDLTKNYEEITQEKLYQLNSLQEHEVEILNNPSVQIAEILNLVSKGFSSNNKLIKDSEEEALADIDFENHTGEGDEIIQTDSQKLRGEKEKKAIHKHIDNVQKYFANELSNFFEKRSIYETPKKLINHKVLANTSTMVDLLFLYYGKRYEVSYTEFSIQFDRAKQEKIHKIEKKYKLEKPNKSNPDDINILYYEIETSLFTKAKKDFEAIGDGIFINQDEYYTLKKETIYIEEGVFEDVKGFGLKFHLINILGRFLICANLDSGFKKYSYDLANDRISNFRKEIFERATFLTLNINWKKKESIYRDVILLDLLNFIYPGEFNENDINLIKENVSSYFKNERYQGQKIPSNFNHYIDNILPSFVKWKNNFSDYISLLNDVNYNSIVYHRNIGFALFLNRVDGDLKLEKPGLPWNIFTKSPSIDIIYNQSKIITFNGI